MVSPGQLFVHTSGRHGAGVFKPLTKQGAIGLAVHPAMTFTGLSLDVQRLNGARFAVTGPAPFIPIAQALVVEMGGEPVHIAEADRALYHAALAHAANHLVTIMGQSQQALASIGVEDPSHYLGPLVRAALDNALAVGETALTGPVIRGDLGTVTEHLRALREYAEQENTRDIADSYAELVKSTAKRAHNRGLLNDEQLGRVESILTEHKSFMDTTDPAPQTRSSRHD
jgi:chalcone/stilbene synthase family protein